MTLQLSDEFAQKVEPFSQWLPTIQELSLIGFRTPTTQTATEIIEYLSSDPMPQDVLKFRINEEQRVLERRRLMVAGIL